MSEWYDVINDVAYVLLLTRVALPGSYCVERAALQLNSDVIIYYSSEERLIIA